MTPTNIINRNDNANEVNARRILKELMYDINLKDCFREMVPTGGFTWKSNVCRCHKFGQIQKIQKF